MGMKRFLEEASPILQSSTAAGVTIAAPTVISTTCAASTTTETCTQPGFCCALANRTTGNTPGTALTANVCVPS